MSKMINTDELDMLINKDDARYEAWTWSDDYDWEEYEENPFDPQEAVKDAFLAGIEYAKTILKGETWS